VIPQDKIPEERCLKSKWVFKVKRNGIFRAGLVACGLSQVPGIDFTEILAPDIRDLLFMIILVGMMLCNLKARFEGIPSGREMGGSKCVFMKSSVEFNVKIVEILKV
jgi:hypothetical protein